MTLTPQQLEDRRTRIGASEVAAILDWDCALRDPTHVRMDPFKTAAAVWASKVLGVDSEVGEAAELGNYLEPSVLRWFSDDAGVQLLPASERPVDGSIVVATLDAAVADIFDQPVEAKTSSIRRMSPLHDQWGPSGSDEIPVNYLLQLQAQLAGTGADFGHVALLIGHSNDAQRRYVIERSQPIIDRILEVCDRFWKLHVLTEKPPEGDPPPLDMMKRVERKQGPAIEVADTLMAEVVASKLALKEAKEREERAKSALLLAMGTSSRAKSGAGEATVRIKKRKASFVGPSEWAELSIKGIDDGE